MPVRHFITVRHLVALAMLTSACSSERAADQPPPTAPQAAVGEPAAPVQTPAPRPEPEAAREPEAVPTGATPGMAAGGARVNADAATQVDFKKRIDAYMDVHNRAVKDGPKMKESNNPAEIKAAQEGLAARIRTARTGAKPGDIFTPAIRDRVRALLAPEMKGEEGRDAKAVLADDAPASVNLQVNSKYPDGASLPTVPANLLVNLPTLPEPLEYRIINKHLILFDSNADIVVDYIANVIK